MAAIDKAAIAWSIAIVAVGVGIAALGMSGEQLTPIANQPVVKATVPPVVPAKTEPQKDPFADLAQKVKEQQPTEKKMAEDMKMTEKAPAAPAAPTVAKTASVSMPSGTAVPGCEETNACYIPASVTIAAGGKVTWKNDDTAAHTVTSGTPANGPDGTFDSSLVMGGKTFEVTLDKAGSYDYFCMVHPWMTGKVIVK